MPNRRKLTTEWLAGQVRCRGMKIYDLSGGDFPLIIVQVVQTVDGRKTSSLRLAGVKYTGILARPYAGVSRKLCDGGSIRGVAVHKFIRRHLPLLRVLNGRQYTSELFYWWTRLYLRGVDTRRSPCPYHWPQKRQMIGAEYRMIQTETSPLFRKVKR